MLSRHDAGCANGPQDHSLGVTSRFQRRPSGNALLKPVILSAILAISAGLPVNAPAQKLEDLRTPSGPLTLEAVGSFYVGGRTISQTADELGLYSGGPVVVDQMYVQYMIPEGHTKPPVVFIHGGTLSGKSYETTPDGRMGWYEYFARKGYPSYVVDQIGRGRSGFNQAPFNDVRAGNAPPKSQPNIRRIATDRALVRFRIGGEDGKAFADTQFPVQAAEELAKQTVPDLYEALPADNPNFHALADLANGLNGAVLISHSQAGQYPFEAAIIDSRHVRAIVAVEPPGCKATVYSSEQLSKLAKIPILVVFGDHLDAPQKFGLVRWTDAFADCQDFVRRVNDIGGNVTLLHLPDIGIHGNSHMMMQDRNSGQIADLIIDWIAQHIR